MITPMPPVNRGSFEQDALRHRPSLHRLALRLTRRPDVAEDLVQDTYLRAWLFQILRHAFISRYRSDKSRGAGVEVQSLVSFSEDRLRSSASLESQSPDPEALVMGAILPGEIHSALAELPPAFREVVTRAFIDELSYQDIADRVGVPIGTVMSRIYRGRKMLRERLHDFAVSRRLVDAPRAERLRVA